MQFSAFTKTTTGNTILFKNEVPIEKVGSIKSYADSIAVNDARFSKKEFRWSFSSTYWSAWQTLTQSNITKIDTHSNYYLFLEIRYVLTGTTVNIPSFTINYIESALGPISSQNHIHDDIETQDTSAKLIHDVIQKYNVTEITNADTLNNYPGSWYLDRTHQQGVQSIATITGLQAILNNLSGAAGITYEYLDGSLAKRDASILWLYDNKSDINHNHDGYYLKETSIGLGFRWNAGMLDVSAQGDVTKAYVDGSLNVKTNFVYDIAQDVSISLKADKTYLDGSLATLNASINLAFASNSSLGTLTTKVNYIDSSLGRTSSLTYALNSSIGNYATNASVNIALSAYATNVSVNTAFLTNSSLASLTAKVNYIDACLGTTSVLTNTLNASISAYTTNASIASVDFVKGVSLNAYTTNASVNNAKWLKESSIGPSFLWNNGLLDVSIKDASINVLYTLVNNISTNVGDTNYTSNLFVNDYDNLTKSISTLDQIMGLIAPAKPALLTGSDASLIGLIKYNAKLPTGLASTWYTDATSGQTITDYIIDTTYILYTPNNASTFRAGLYNDSSAAGSLTAVINGVDLVTYNINLGLGNVSIGTSDVSGLLRCSSISGFGGAANNFWRKAEAFIQITNQKEGAVSYAIKHTEALTTNTSTYRYDNVNSTPWWARNPSANLVTDNSVYLSGISHYGTNSTFLISASVGSGIFYKAYHPTNVIRVSSTLGSNTNINPSVVPDASARFDASTLFTFNTANVATTFNNAVITVTAYKPNGTTLVYNASTNRRANTYSTTRASITVEYFTDESRRIKDGSSGTDLAWSSNDYSIFNPDNGPYAQVRNGILTYPIAADYAGFAFSGVDKMYMRRFTKATASSGSLTFAGFVPNTQLSPFGAGDVNILIWLTDQGLYFDLGRAFGVGGGSGLTMATGISAYSSLSATAINWTLGTYSTGNEVAHVGTYVVIVVLRNTARTMTQITAA